MCLLIILINSKTLHFPSNFYYLTKLYYDLKCWKTRIEWTENVPGCACGVQHKLSSNARANQGVCKSFCMSLFPHLKCFLNTNLGARLQFSGGNEDMTGLRTLGFDCGSFNTDSWYIFAVVNGESIILEILCITSLLLVPSSILCWPWACIKFSLHFWIPHSRNMTTTKVIHVFKRGSGDSFWLLGWV